MFNYFKELYRQRVDESDMLLCAGTTAISVGVYQIFPPASFIFVGLIFLGLAFLQAKGGN